MSMYGDVDAYAKWLTKLGGEQGWSFFLTATCPSGEKRTARSWRRSMERTMLQPYMDGTFQISRGFWGLERHKSGSFHAHALIQMRDVFGMHLNGAGDAWERETESAIASDIWSVLFERFGRSECIPFDPELGAAHYVSKYCFKANMSGELDWDIFIRDVEAPENAFIYT